MAVSSNQDDIGSLKVVPKFLRGDNNRPNAWSIAAILVGTVACIGLLVSWFNPTSSNSEFARPQQQGVVTHYVTVLAQATSTPSPSLNDNPTEDDITGDVTEPNIEDVTEDLAQDLASSASVQLNSSRAVDGTNSFASFKQTAHCSFSSLDLHEPFEPLCDETRSLMLAMSGGGRQGFDMPYRPLGCDMRWYTPDEICEILDRFEEVMIYGDSQMRGLGIAFQSLTRADLYDGGRPSWRGGVKEEQCHCNSLYFPGCKYYCLYSTKEVRQQDPKSMYCDQRNTTTRAAGIEYREVGAYPRKQREYDDIVAHRSKTRPKKPYAFILGHGLRNNLKLKESRAWITDLIKNLRKLSYYKDPDAFMPRLFITSSAAGLNKPWQFLGVQGNVRLRQYEIAMAPWVRERGFEHLGTYNLTIQTEIPDGTHDGMKNDLTKAMMALNWLDRIDTSPWYA